MRVVTREKVRERAMTEVMSSLVGGREGAIMVESRQRAIPVVIGPT